MAEVTFERILKWRLLPRGMMLVMTYAYLQTLFWFQSLPPDAMTTHVLITLDPSKGRTSARSSKRTTPAAQASDGLP